jgi:hypothetical protein
MAELGSIDFVDVNRGTSQIDRRDELRGLNVALDATKKVVDESIKSSVTRDMIDAIEADADPVIETKDSFTTEISDPAQASLQADLDRWKALAAQGNSSERALAEMRIKGILNTAQARFGWLAEDLQARAGMVVSGSHELEQLGFKDAQVNAEAKAAQAQLDEIQDYATKQWSEGGLGISPHIPIGSGEWLAQYVAFDELRQAKQMNDRYVGMVMSNAEASAVELEDAATTLIQGSVSTARYEYQRILSDNGFYEVIREVQKGDQGDLETIRQFQDVAVPVILQELVGLRQGVIAANEQFFSGRMAGTEPGKRHKARMDDYLKELDSSITLLKSGVEQLPSALQQIDALTQIRGMNVARSLSEPYQNYVAFRNGMGKNLLDDVRYDLTASGLNLKMQVGAVSTSLLQNRFSDFFGPNANPSSVSALAFATSGQGLITPSMPPSEINSTLDKIQRDSPTPWVVKTNTDAEEAEAALFVADQHTKRWQAALQVPEEGTPDKAAGYLTGINNSIRAFNAMPEQYADVSTIIRSGLADDNLLKAIDTVGDDPTYVNTRRAFGISAKEWYVRTNPADRQAHTLQTYNTATIEGIPLREIARVSIDAMRENGDFKYETDNENFKAAVDRRYKRTQATDADLQADIGGSRTRRTRTQIENEIYNEVLAIMAPIEQEVNESITISRNLDHATALNSESRRRSNVKLQFFQELGWINGFNYTSTEGK